MNKAVVLLASGFLAASAQAADLAVLSSVAIKDAYLEAAPQFEKSSGHKLVTTWSGTTDIMNRMKAGAVFDVVILAADGLEILTDTGKIMAGSRSDIAKSGIGVAVRAGAPRPDIGSPEALKRALLAAKSIGVSTGPSGVYLTGLMQRMGVLTELQPRLRIPPSGAAVGELVAKGEAEIGFQQVSELVRVKGIQLLGPLPAEIQRTTVFAGGVHVGSQEPDAARALLRFLAHPENAALLQKHGLEPGASQY
jgi:molybdate transport system substrate-binding protein